MLNQPTEKPELSVRGTRKRSLVVALLLVVALIAAACGGSTDDESTDDNNNGDTDNGSTEVAQREPQPENCPITAHLEADSLPSLTIWHAYNAKTQEALEDFGEQFAQETGTQVNVEAQGTYPELLAKYESAMMSDINSLPDIIFAEDTNLQFLIDSETVIAAEDCIAADEDSQDFYNDLLPSVRSTYSVNGSLWAAAYGVSMPIMYYNKAHFTAAGLDPESPPETLEEVRTAAQALKESGVATPVVQQLDGWYVENWINGAGELTVNNNNGRDALATESLFNNEATQEIFDWLSTMATEGLYQGFTYGSGIDQFLALANQGSSILIDGSRALTAVDAVVQDVAAGETSPIVEGLDGVDLSNLTGIEIGVAPIPGLTEAGQGAVAGSSGYIVTKEPEVVSLAWAFMRFFNSPEIQVRWTIDGSYLPVTESVQESAEMQEYFTTTRPGGWLSIANDQVLGVDPDFASAAMGPYNSFRAGVRAMMDRVVLDLADPTAEIEAFDRDFQSDLDAYRAEVGG